MKSREESAMHVVCPLIDDVRVTVVVRAQTEERLRNRCFRRMQVAGCFCEWRNADDVLSGSDVGPLFFTDLRENWEKKDFGTHSVQITARKVVGWESTAPASEYADDVLEPFQPNRQSSALRVKLTRTDLRAPKTNFVTIVYEFKEEKGAPVAVVHSMYPGKDIGDLYGDVTKREQRIFFDFLHPGAPL